MQNQVNSRLYKKIRPDIAVSWDGKNKKDFFTRLF
jgi:hypothetical protein